MKMRNPRAENKQPAENKPSKPLCDSGASTFMAASLLPAPPADNAGILILENGGTCRDFVPPRPPLGDGSGPAQSPTRIAFFLFPEGLLNSDLPGAAPATSPFIILPLPFPLHFKEQGASTPHNACITTDAWEGQGKNFKYLSEVAQPSGTKKAARSASGAGRSSSWLALILTFSPWGKEQPSHDSGCVDAWRANPVAGFSGWRRMILPLLGGEGTVRSSLLTGSASGFASPCGGETGDIFSC